MSSKLPQVDCQQLINVLKRLGFEEQRQRGSHLHLY
jgi:predicted RNA binding protein YcfA (HicA-like mRNA interferase family)